MGDGVAAVMPMNTSPAPSRPVLRYHGGKWLLAPWIIRHFPPHRVYVEPFGGAASVLLQKSRAYAEVYNDLDGEIVNLFRVLRAPEQARELERLLRLTPYSRVEFDESYMPSDDPVEQARRTMLRSFAGFSGVGTTGRRTGFRSTTRRSGTVPATDWAALPDVVAHFTARLAGVVIEQGPAVDVIARYDGADTLHYVDPPYPFATRTTTARWDSVYRHEMSDDDHRALAQVLRSLSGMVVLSGYPCELYDVDLFPDWHRVTRRSHADGARDRTEVLWLNERASSMLRQIHLDFPELENRT